MLILDDSTSSVDVETESQDSGRAGAADGKDRTSFVIAQRISTVLNADKILVLDDGRDRRRRHAQRAAGIQPHLSRNL